jgi:hypothetical protein
MEHSLRIFAGDDFNSYLDRLIKMIPSEVIGLYLVGVGAITQTASCRVVLLIWAIFCLICVFVVRIYGTKLPGKKPQWAAIVISAVSFTIWVYTIPKGPFDLYGIYIPVLGSLLVLGWTFVIPYFYKGDPTNAH